MVRPRKTLSSILLAAALMGGCAGDGDAPGALAATDDTSSATNAPVDAIPPGTDDCGNGGAFPDDPEFRELMCQVFLAQNDVLRTGGEMDPGWGGRLGQLPLTYGEDREAAVYDAEALLEEMRAAADG